MTPSFFCMSGLLLRITQILRIASKIIKAAYTYSKIMIMVPMNNISPGSAM